MGKMVAPFSNATEAEMWLNRNCYSCTTSKNCTAFKHLEEGFIFGGISERTARYIGTVNITAAGMGWRLFLPLAYTRCYQLARIINNKS